MKFYKYIASILLGLMLTLFSVTEGFSQGSQPVFEVEDVPNVQVGDSLRFTSDPAHFFNENAVASLDEALHNLRLRWGVDAALVVLPSIGDRAIEEFAVDLFRTWGLGSKKTNSGLLILLVMDSHKIFINTGYGLEGNLPDATCSGIIRNRMIPFFKEDQYQEGLLSGIAAVDEVLETGKFEGAERTDPASGYQGEDKDTDGLYTFWFFYILIILYTSVKSYKQLNKIVEKKGKYAYQTPFERLARLKSKNRTYGLIFGIACLPIGILLYIFGKYHIGKLTKESKRCPRCQKDTLQPITDTNKLYALLDDRQHLETVLKSREYGAQECSLCGYQQVYPIRELYSRYSRCPNCGTYAYHSWIEKGDSDYDMVYYKCEYCKHQDRKKRYKSNSASTAAVAAAAGSVFGGWSSGGFGSSRGSSGGGWGGGSTGGGGAGGSW